MTSIAVGPIGLMSRSQPSWLIFCQILWKVLLEFFLIENILPKFEQIMKINKSKSLKVVSFNSLVRFVTCHVTVGNFYWKGIGVKVAVSTQKLQLTARRMFLNLGNYLEIDILKKLTEPDFWEKIWFLIKKLICAFLGTLNFVFLKLR